MASHTSQMKSGKSASHIQKNMVAVILHHQPVGIDVEIEGRDINKIAKKFMSPDELKNISDAANKEKMLLLHWCAKEAVFKCTKHEGIDFRNHINMKNLAFQGKVHSLHFSKKGKQKYLRSAICLPTTMPLPGAASQNPDH